MTKAKVKEQPALFEQEQPRGNIQEGSVKKNTNPPPTTARPPTPKSQTAPKPGTAVEKVRPMPRTDLLAAVVRASSDPNCSAEKMHSLLDARDRLMRQQAEVGFRKAYRAVKLAMPRIDKDGKIDEGTTRSGRQGKKARYASYENLNEIIEPVIRDNGLDLSLHSEPKPGSEGVMMRATLSYIANTDYGETVYSESSLVPMPPDPTGSKNGAQAMSSALAYAKRNAVIIVLNIVSYAPEDRDLDGHDPKPKRGTAAAQTAAAEPEMEDVGEVQFSRQ